MGKFLYKETKDRPILQQKLRESPFFTFIEPFYKDGETDKVEEEEAEKVEEEESENESDDDGGKEVESKAQVDSKAEEVEAEVNEKMFKKSSRGIEILLRAYNKVTKKFHFGESDPFAPTARDFALIFGFRRVEESPEVVELLKEGVTDTHRKFMVDNFNKVPRVMISKTKIEEKLTSAVKDETNPVFFIRTLAMWLCTVIFFTDSGGSNFAQRWLPHIFLMDEVSWPDHILNFLVEKMEKGGGCTTFLLVKKERSKENCFVFESCFINFTSSYLDV